jgi:drug/metabolite transporter (DMT)-like permease
VANSTLLVNLAPVFVALGGWLLFGERFAYTFLVGMAVALGAPFCWWAVISASG